MNAMKLRIALLVFLLAAPVVNAQEATRQSSESTASPAMPAEVVFESNVGDVHFPHMLHMKFGCTSCHHQVSAGELDTPHPDYLESSWINCGDCHDQDSETVANSYSCSGCHHSEPENIADETLSAKVVVHESCWKCHGSGTGVEASKGCIKCHQKAVAETQQQ